MNRRELEQRTDALNPKLSIKAIELLRLTLELSAEGKLKNSVMQNEIPNLLQNVEESEKLQHRINSRRFFLQFAGLIDSASAIKLKIPNDVELNVQKKSTVDEKISSLIILINKILREDGPLDVDFDCKNLQEGVEILKYSGLDFDVLKIPETIKNCPVIAIGAKVFEGKQMYSVEFPTGLREIGTGAFQNCKFLASVTLPANIVDQL